MGVDLGLEQDDIRLLGGTSPSALQLSSSQLPRLGRSLPSRRTRLATTSFDFDTGRNGTAPVAGDGRKVRDSSVGSGGLLRSAGLDQGETNDRIHLRHRQSAATLTTC